MPPATHSSSPNPGEPSFEEIYTTYWKAKTRYETLEYDLTNTASPHDRLSIQKELDSLEAHLLSVEEGMKARGLYARLTRRPSVHARAGSSYDPYRSSTVSRQSLADLRSRVDRVQYGGGTYTSPSYGVSRTEREESARISVREGEGPFRRLKEVPPYTAGLARATTEVAELETEYFRDTHHGPGVLRTVTKAGWTAGAVAMQTFAGVIAAQIMGGHVPFDVFPNFSDDDYEDECDDD